MAGNLPLGATSIAQLLITIFSGGTLAAAFAFLINWRKLSQSAEKVLRDHYASELARLTKKIEDKDEHILRIERHLRDIIKQADDRYEECQNERDRDRARLAEMQREIDGLKRQVPALSADQLLIMEGRRKPGEPHPAPQALAAAKRVKENGFKS